MGQDLTIVMYHYVRNLALSRYPAVKARDLAEFRFQLDYIARHHTVVTAEEVMAAALGEMTLPENACWLTFDDGYIDHYLTVFPLLHERRWQGSFFPPARTGQEDGLLDVNRIHFTLAVQQDPAPLIADIRAFVDERTGEPGIRPFDEYWMEWAHPSRFDPAPVVFVKRMLQQALPGRLRSLLSDMLFRRYVSVDPASFAAELYMSDDQLRLMQGCGMYVGSHGSAHCWMDRLDRADQERDIDQSLAFLDRIGAPTDRWVMCYPYGLWNASLLEVARARGAVVGLTTQSAVARIGCDDPLLLPRLDTNELPIAAALRRPVG